jgi:hypothetical protein
MSKKSKVELFSNPEKGGEDVVLNENGNGIALVKWAYANPIEHNFLKVIKSERKVVMGQIKPIRKLELDGEDVFEIKTTRSFIGNAEEIQMELKKQGVIVNKSKASDCINALLQGLELPVEKGHATYGIFLNGELKLELCLNPHPRTEIQKQLHRQINRHTTIEASKRDLEAYFNVLSFWHDYEVLPVMSASVLAPLNLALRGRGFMVPNIYNVAEQSGLGKSEVTIIFCTKLFGVSSEPIDSINSPYRFADKLDSGGVLFPISEAENFNWEKWGPHLQHSSESPHQDRRGSGDYQNRLYLSRFGFVFTGNYLNCKRKASLVRLIRVEFDRTKLRERIEKRSEYVKVKKHLKAIGWRIVEAELERIEWDIDVLLDLIETHASEIESLYKGSFDDPRRATAWGYIYEGLKAWEFFAKQLGCDWKAPSYEEFVSSVVDNIEPETFRSVEAPASQFITWWESWKSLNTISGVGPKGFGEIWDSKNTDREKGDVITKSVLALYEKENRYKGPIASISLVDLGKGVASLYGYSNGDIYKERKIAGKTYKTVLIPDKQKILEGGNN